MKRTENYSSESGSSAKSTHHTSESGGENMSRDFQLIISHWCLPVGFHVETLIMPNGHCHTELRYCDCEMQTSHNTKRRRKWKHEQASRNHG
jgi:hypothetical protein